MALPPAPPPSPIFLAPVFRAARQLTLQIVNNYGWAKLLPQNENHNGYYFKFPLHLELMDIFTYSRKGFFGHQ